MIARADVRMALRKLQNPDRTCEEILEGNL